MAVLAAAPRLTPSRGGFLRRQRRGEVKAIGNFRHFGEVVQKDFEFLKKGIKKGINWANEKFRVNQVARTVDDVLWLKHLEDPEASGLETQMSWPQPYYPGLTGVDLLMADLKALEVYARYFYFQSKALTKPLPEVYDPQAVSDYFACRPHVVALRLIEVFVALASATIRIRTSGIGNILPLSRVRRKKSNTSQYDFGIILKETILGLGPTFIKVGQSLSTRPDIIGSDISKALSELHDQIPPFPKTTAMKIIEEELGSPVKTIFSYLSDEPIAAASFGQVYRGITLDGCNVAVKVQRPNLRHVVVRDIYILRLGLGIVQKVAKRKNDLRLYADELGKGLVGELDYSLEATNASKFAETHSSFHFMHVPKIYRHLSRKRVLTMEWLDGESPTDLMFASTSNAVGHDSSHLERQIMEGRRRLLDLVKKGVEATLVQLLETGLLHADPHPGNLRYTASGQLGFLDFGLLCQMENKHRFAMLASIVQIVNGDWASLVQSLIQMDVIRPGTNIRLVTMELEEALGEVEFKDGIPDVKFSRVLGKIWSVALKYHFRMPPYYTLVLRSLASLEGLAVAADPNFRTFEAAYPYVVRKLLTENSVETRKILHSVVLNRRKEFRWERVALFLRVGSTRKILSQTLSSKGESAPEYKPNKSDVVNLTQLVMRLLSSSEGFVLRKLLMTADGTSLVRAMVSKEAASFRLQISKAIADILYQWMVQTVGLPSRLPTPNEDYLSILRDRRLRVIFSRVVVSARKEPLLMLKFCCISFIVVLRAVAMSIRQVLMSVSEAFVGRLSLAPARVEISA